MMGQGGLTFLILLSLIALQLVLVVDSTGPHTQGNASPEYLLNLIKSSSPDGVDPKFDCAWRKMALKYAVKLQPWLSTQKLNEMSDALQIPTKCPKELYRVTDYVKESYSLQATEYRSDAKAALSVFVDAAKGSDTNSGHIDAPLKTLQAAVELVRKSRGSSASPAIILLREGTFYLKNTVLLGPQDSDLTIRAYNNEKAVISGARALQNIKWQKKPDDGRVVDATNIYTADLSGFDLPSGVPALHVDEKRGTRARFPNANPERDLFPIGYIKSAAWSKPMYHGKVCDPSRQCGQSRNVTVKVPTSEWHGMYQDYTQGYGGACEVYDPPRSPWCSGQFYLERQFPEMHTRHPSGMTPSSLPHSPYHNAKGAVVHAWRPGHWYTWMFEVESQSGSHHVDTWTVHRNQNNVWGIAESKQDTDDCKYLGTFNTDTECWAACNNSMHTKHIKCSTWTHHATDFGDPAWNGGCYMMVDGVWGPTAEDKINSGRGPHTEGGTFKFGRGGNQGGEGNDGAGEWWIENVIEELDAPNEWFFDNQTKLLTFYYNATGQPPSTITVPTLAGLIRVSGTQAKPVRNITFSGLTVTANRPTYLDPRGNPSGGDWALEREGALLFEGAQGCLIENSVFVRLDSNAVFLSGYNRYITVLKNEFVNLGQSAIASWGFAKENDGTNGEQPRFTHLEGNFVHEIGHIQKQSSFYFQGVAAQSTIVNNIVFNIPRAGINFNDGFGGGNEITQNLMFNTCRESSDHGAFNSWDRLPYITKIRTGVPSTIPADNNVHHNFIVANYAADGGCLDNDDGSSYYNIHHNMCVFGGHKSDFDGNRKVSHHNLHIYPSVYGVCCVNIGAQALPPKGYAEGYNSNKCILPNANSPYLRIGDVEGGHCLKTAAAMRAWKNGLELGNNTIYVPLGAANVQCGGNTLSFKKFQSEGYDPTTTITGNMPSADTIIQWSSELLHLE